MEIKSSSTFVWRCFVARVLLVVVSLAGLQRVEAASVEAGLMDGVAAVVNDRKILYSDVARNAFPAIRKLSQVYNGQELQTRVDEVYRKILTNMVERATILESCENPNEEGVNLMVDAQLEDVLQSSFKGDRGALLDALSAEHMTIQEWKNDMRDNILVSIFKRNEVDTKVLLSPNAVRKEYDANRSKYVTAESFLLRTIAVAVEESSGGAEGARTRAETIRQQAGRGDDFVSLQKNASADGQVAEPEWVGPGDLRPEVSKAVSAMKEGEIGPVIQAGDSFLIIKLESRRAAKPTAFEDVRSEIERQLKQKEQNRLYDQWIQRLRKQVNVKVIQEGMVQK
ncbi:MAG: peptidyl-prolyl cis-trans isomerase [bacterium]